MKKTPDVPSPEDISPTLGVDPDEKLALDVFLGMSFEKAVKFFQSTFASDFYLLFWMGPNGFAYYFPAVKPFLESRASNFIFSYEAGLIARMIRARLYLDPVGLKLARGSIIEVLELLLRKFPNNRMKPSRRLGINAEIAESINNDLELKLRRLLADVLKGECITQPPGTPSLIDISPSHGLQLDENTALENFLGKTFEEAVMLFHEKAFYYAGDFLWMGPKGFSFYFPAVLPYLQSAASDGDSDTVSRLVGTVNHIMSHNPTTVMLARDKVLEILSHIQRNIPKYDVDEAIYGKFEVRLKKVIARVNSAT